MSRRWSSLYLFEKFLLSLLGLWIFVALLMASDTSEVAPHGSESGRDLLALPEELLSGYGEWGLLPPFPLAIQ
jgi:hypothetical protein